MYKLLRGAEYKPFVESKGSGSFVADYLSWAVVHDKLKETFQYVEYTIHEYTLTTKNGPCTVPYMLLPNGSAMVKVTLKVIDFDGDEHLHEECLAVRDFKMQAQIDPDSAQVENTIRRCIAKAGSMLTGFGIELWFGEDIRDLSYRPQISENAHKLARLSEHVDFKGTSVSTQIKSWLATNPTQEEILVQYTKLKDKQLGIREKKKKEKEKSK